jgi:dehydrogenase/reductase SDR family member 4
MPKPLTGKIALVTGAAQGTGRAYSRALAQAGATVIATSRSMRAPPPGEQARPNTLAELADLARREGEDIHVMTCDVSEEAQIRACVDQVIETFGRIDVVVNNAATYPMDQPEPHFDPLGISVAEWNRYNQVNVVGPYLMMCAVVPHMIKQGSGNIVNITSSAALGVEVRAAQLGMAAYVTTKAALNRLTQFFAFEYEEQNIAVNALCPGAVVTQSWRGVPEDMQQEMLDTGQSRLPTPEAMGPSILYLVQQTAQTLTGQILKTDDFGTLWGD